MGGTWWQEERVGGLFLSTVKTLNTAAPHTWKRLGRRMLRRVSPPHTHTQTPTPHVLSQQRGGRGSDTCVSTSPKHFK